MPRLLVVAVVLAGILAGAGAAQYLMRTDGSVPALERAVLFSESRPIPDLALVDQSGQPFGAARLRGGWTFVFFGFVNCPDVCPTTLATLAAARKQLADLPPAELPAVALVSVDPGRDTPEILARYVTHFDPSFSGVTGSPEAIGALTAAVGVAVIIGPEAADGGYSIDHSAAILLVNPEGRVAAMFGAPHEASTIARDYRHIVAAS
jgi:protein SCO1/2